MPVHRKVVFPTENDESRGFSLLFDKGSPISYLGERRYVVSEDDCKVLRENGVTYNTLDSQQ
jgi:hypothetical protein